jgi:hypothetical protein
MTLQPYQEAGQEINRQQAEPGRLLKGSANIALGVASGGAILNKIIPFLSKYIPFGLALKGISKVEPRLGKFIQGSINQGHAAEEVMDFVREKITPSEEKRRDTLKKFNDKKIQPNLQEREMARTQEAYGQQQVQQGQSDQQSALQPQQRNNADQDLMAAIQKVLQM